MRHYNVTEDLKKVFIEDEKYDEYKDFIKEKLLSKFDWRKGFRHLDIYNRANHKSGILEKLELCRRDISCQSAEEIIDILYTIGYSHKRIVFILWEWGYDLINRKIVAAYLVKKKFYLKRKRIDFMELIQNAKDEVFQNCKEEVLKAEAKTVELYLDAIGKLQTQLSEIDVSLGVKERLKFENIAKSIERMQETLNRCHGVQDIRKQTVRIMAEVNLAKRLKEVENEKTINLEDAHAKTIDAGGSNLLE